MTSSESRPHLIDGGLRSDARGTVTFVNDFDFVGVDRFYTIRSQQPNVPRGWVGHQRDQKWFTAIYGAVLVTVVRPDDWESPSSDLPVARYVLSRDNPQVLHVPAGHATGSAHLSDGAILMVFSSGKIKDAKTDEYRFPVDQWDILTPGAD